MDDPFTYDIKDINDNNHLLRTYFYNHVFSKDECETILALKETHPTSESRVVGTTPGGVLDTTIRNSRSTYLNLNDPEKYWIAQRLGPLVKTTNDAYFKFKVAAFSGSQIIEYNPDSFYDWHIDVGVGPTASRKLSVVVFLAPDSAYEGGRLEIQSGNRIPEQVPQGQGTLVIFPSYLLHRVAPVTTGVRNTLVTWLHGPCFS